MVKKDIEIIYVDIQKIKPAEYNPRQANEKEYADLTESIKNFGIVDPFIVNSSPKRKNILIGGHFRLKIVKELGFKVIPVVYTNIADEKKERELNLRLNKNLGSWDFNLLANFDEDLLKNVGFESEELDKIFQLNLENKDADNVPEKRETNIKLGNIFKLGEHRVMCADSTEKWQVEALVGEHRADMVFTDPPYGVDYEGYTKSKLKIKNDSSSVQEELLSKVFINYVEFAKKGASLYVCHASRYQREFQNLLKQSGIAIRCQIIWAKNTFAWGFGRYKFQHEPMFYCYINGENDAWYGDKRQSTLWEIKKPSANRLHPTMKPVELCERAILNSSKREDIVTDFFGGSGSTLMACEKTNRKCYMMELDPVYCQVIIDRWEEFAGQKAVKL